MNINFSVVYISLGLVIALVMAALISLQAGLYASFFLVLSWWVWENNTKGFFFFLVIAPLLPILKITQSIETITLLKDVIIISLFTKLYFIPLLTKRLAYRRSALMIPIVLLIFWTVVNVGRSDSMILGVLRARDILLYLLLYFVVLYMPKEKIFYGIAARWFLSSAAIITMLGIYQWFLTPDSAVLRFDPARSIWIPRISSLLAHPSVFGHYLLAVSTLLFALVLTGVQRFRVWAIIFLLGLMPLVYLTYSRAVWLGYAIALLTMSGTYFWSRTSWTKFNAIFQPRIVVMSLMTLILVLLAIFKFTSVGVFLKSSIDPAYASNAERLSVAVRLIAPLTNMEALVGRGLGNVTEQVFRETQVNSFAIASGASQEIRQAKDMTLVDNQYLKTFIELGLTGILLYIWIFAMCLRLSFQLVLENRTPTTGIIGLCGLGFISAFIVQGFFIDVWDIFPTNALFWILVGLITVASQPSFPGGKSNERV